MVDLNYIKDEIEALHKKFSYLDILNKNVIDIDECVYLTGLKKQTLYKYTSECIIPHYKPEGKKIYFKRVEVEQWMLSNRVSTINESKEIAIKKML